MCPTVKKKIQISTNPPPPPPLQVKWLFPEGLIKEI